MTAEPTVVLHPHHPRGVADAMRGVAGIRLVEPTGDEMVEAAASAEILVTFKWDDRFLAPGLGWIQSISAGVDQFPVAAIEERGVALTSASGLHAVPVSEHAFALLLALTRGVGVSTRDATGHVWKPRMNREISGKTLLVLGLGAIGGEIARRAAAWGMEVIGVKRDPGSYDGEVARVFAPERLVEAAAQADVIVSVLPDTPATRGLVGREALSALGAGWFVNVGRGTVVAEDDLVWALDEGELIGAGLDVFEHEPLPDASPLWDHPRVVITPHTGGLSPMYGPRLAEIFRINLAAFNGIGEWTNRVV